MSVRTKIADNAAPHLQPGEAVQHVLIGQTRSQGWLFAGAILASPLLPLFFVVNRYRSIVVTDRRVLVFDSGHLVGTKAKSLVAELPRTTVLGPWPGGLWARFQVGDQALSVHRSFRAEVDALSPSYAAVR